MAQPVPVARKSTGKRLGTVEYNPIIAPCVKNPVIPTRVITTKMEGETDAIIIIMIAKLVKKKAVILVILTRKARRPMTTSR